MAKQVTLENTLAGGFGLPTGQIVPGNGSIVVEPEVWAAAEHHPVVAARVKAGTIIVDGQGKKAAEALVGEALQARVTELEALLKTANDEITKLKDGNGGQSAFEAKHRGAGSYSIMEGETELREKLTKDQADAFNKLDPDGKAKWLSDNPKPSA